MLTWLKTRLRGQGGFAMPAVLATILLTTIAGLAAINTVDQDIFTTHRDDDGQRAWEAAVAGLEWYQYQLNHDVNYWASCASVAPIAPGQPAPVNQAWSGSGADPRIWRLIGDTTATYTTEILPAPGATQCLTSSPATTALTGNTLRIRATGRFRTATRSLIATFKRPGFLDFLYFTDLETKDPVTYGASSSAYPAWATTNCTYWRTGRGSRVFTDPISHNSYSPGCAEIQFPTGDAINGPLHTNDELLVCGAPVFGRSGDKVEVSASAGAGWRQASGCSGSPTMTGTFRKSAPVLAIPPTNAALSSYADPSYRFTGATRIVFNTTSMNVTTGTGTVTRALPPPNGVIYVANGTCGSSYQLSQTYSTPTGCAVVAVSGTYSSSITLASQGDILVVGDLIAGGSALPIGLIADNFVRVYHPVTSGSNCANSTGPWGGVLANLRIDAAILALNHSFLVDNWACGPPLGTLTVNGAIAQKYRGPVGTGSGATKVSGYTKAYSYNDRLHTVEPPNFIDPVQSAWKIIREVEQHPATK